MEPNNNNNITLKLWTLSAEALPPVAPFVINDGIPLYERTHPGITIEPYTADDWDEFYNTIVNSARTKSSEYDIFITNPIILGSALEYGGFANLCNYFDGCEEDNDDIDSNSVNNKEEEEEEQDDFDANDILDGYRDIIYNYEQEPYMMPFDGDSLHLFYNIEIMEAFNVSTPRTWDEYTQVASVINGKEYNGNTLVGSCVDRTCLNEYWATMVLSSMTQTHGYQTGSLFSTTDMSPLLGEAMERTLNLMKEQNNNGPSNELDNELGCLTMNLQYMDEGICGMTFNWGNSFKGHLLGDSVLRGKLGVAALPGSTVVLDRETDKLVPCNEESCPHATNYDGIGLVNHSPYAAFGGWSGAANAYSNHVDEAKKFLAWFSSPEISMKYVVANSTSNMALSGFDPFRASQMNVSKWVEQGYEVKSTTEYVNAVKNTLDSPNMVIDIRFSSASKILSVLSKVSFDYLNGTYGFDEEGRRLATREIETAWDTIIKEHDETSPDSELVQYQKLRGVYNSGIDEEGKGYAAEDGIESGGDEDSETSGSVVGFSKTLAVMVTVASLLTLPLCN